MVEDFKKYQEKATPPEQRSRRNFLIHGATATVGSFAMAAGSEASKKYTSVGLPPTDIATYSTAIGSGAAAFGTLATGLEYYDTPLSRRDAMVSVVKNVTAMGTAHLAGKVVADQLNPVTELPFTDQKPEPAPSWQARLDQKKQTPPNRIA